ncbi:hypothetical protein ACOI22_00550 [Glaciecola sp. 2405UD65-10]|uniref:hypothetical protein n=1 Tax=Glaciecola sp. 2405UD65-10 TaxID=3397244 RepID=UPI003B5A6BFD
MNTLKLITESGNEEAWLFADLFASLLMTIVLLVNVHTLQASPQTTDQEGADAKQTRLLFLHADGNVSIDEQSNPSMSLKEAITQFQSSDTQVEIVGTTNANSLVLYTAFSQLSQQNIQYVFTAEQ